MVRKKKNIKYLKDNTKYDYGVFTEGGKPLIHGGATLKDAKYRAESYAEKKKGNVAVIRKKICRVKSK